jgi:hypothetical protein
MGSKSSKDNKRRDFGLPINKNYYYKKYGSSNIINKKGDIIDLVPKSETEYLCCKETIFTERYVWELGDDKYVVVYFFDDVAVKLFVYD